jgi:diguanylate cyclase (GGDEF)-like protein/PAS domain S-box-containing protein
MKIAHKLVLGYLLVAALAGIITFTAVGTSFIFLLAVIPVFYISRSIAKRIIALREAAEKFSAGKPNTEIGDLRGPQLELLASEGCFRSVVESANDAIICLNERGKILSWNGAASRTFGYESEKIIGESIALLFPPAYSKQLLDESLSGSALMCMGPKPTELTGLRRDASEFPLELSLSSWSTAEGRLFGAIIRDVTDRKSLEEQLTHQALHDPLTSLANRVLFQDRVAHALEKMTRTHDSASVLLIDLDNFKSINDSIGNAAGDALLKAVANRLQTCLRPSDTAARFGGDKFAVLIEGSDRLEGGVLVAERIRDTFRTPFTINDSEVFVGVSIGIATTIDGNDDPLELQRNADAAMYMAKSEGKDRYIVFEREMHEAVVDRLHMESDLHKAIQQKEFEIYYQPIIDLSSKRTIGMEALTRWRHPERGLIPPMEFIPLAEETNLIVPLGAWILEEACRQAREWQLAFESEERIAITVNISSRQFQDSSLLPAVKRALAMSGLLAGDLILEMTEGTMLANSQSTLEKFYELKELGVQLAIDDFGTGYSSLSYLQRFPIDILKIDKTFIDKIDRGPEASAVTQAILTMSNSLHLRTIAEGIEHPEQILKLQNLGCEMGQGFHFARPMRKGEMGNFLQRALAAAFSHREAAAAFDKRLALAG